MTEERLVFDFTDEEMFEKTCLNSFLYKYYSTAIEKEIIYTENNKVKIIYENEKGKLFSCYYKLCRFKSIVNLIEEEQDIKINGCFIEEFDISKLENYYRFKIRNIDARFSYWKGDVVFRNIKFMGEETSFDFAKFSGGKLDFGNAIFEESDVSFAGAEIKNEKVDFSLTTFRKGILSFHKVNFNTRTLDFNETLFSCEYVDFWGTKFINSEVEFEYSVFENCNVDINEALFDSCRLEFIGIELTGKRLNFYSTIFKNTITSFVSIIFNDTILSLLDSYAEKLIIDSCILRTHLLLKYKNIGEIDILRCTIEKVVKINGEPNFFSFADTVNLGQVHFSDEPSVIVKAIENSFKKDEKLTSKQKLDQLTLIKENYHALGEYDGEDLAYQTYMKYKTKFMKLGITKFFYKLFGEIGSYGTKPGNIIMWMFISWLSFAGVFFALLKDQISPALDRLSHALYFSGITFLTIGYGDINPLGDAARFLAVAEGFIGLFLMSYLTVAVVRKLLR